jgi:protein SCO1/2
MKLHRSWIVIALVAIGAAIAGAWLARELDSSGPQLTSGTWLPQPMAVGEFRLRDHLDRPFTAEQLRGSPSIVFFGFTHCPDVCPTTLATLSRVRKEAEVPGLRLLFVSVDPERDTPQAMASYVKAFDPELVGLTGDATTIKTLTQHFGVASQKVDLPGGGYTVDHSAVIFVLDEEGRRVAVFTQPFDAAKLTEDLRRAEPYLRS